MMKQMLLAQMLTEGAEATQSSSALPWGTWIPSVIGLLGSLIVAWWSGRKIDKQMELSKQATPPELTRYKTWLEVSEVFKKLEGVKDTGTLADSKEYQEIEASRKVALERAVWERKVISECSNIQAQKLVMEIPESKIYEIHNPDIYRGIELSVDSYIKPKASGILWLIPLSMLSLFPILTVIISGGSSGDRKFAVIFLLVMPILLFLCFVILPQINIAESLKLTISLGKRGLRFYWIGVNLMMSIIVNLSFIRLISIGKNGIEGRGFGMHRFMIPGLKISTARGKGSAGQEGCGIRSGATFSPEFM